MRFLAAGAVLAVLAVAAAPAPAAPTRTCRSTDLRYPFMPGGPKTFGVFKLRVTGGTCSTAHRVAKAWMAEFEANLRAGSEKLPRSVQGFAFKNLPAHAAQTYTERGRRAATTVRFDYVVPNG